MQPHELHMPKGRGLVRHPSSTLATTVEYLRALQEQRMEMIEIVLFSPYMIIPS